MIGAIDGFQMHVPRIKAAGIIRPDDAAMTVLELRATAPLCEQETVDASVAGAQFR